MAEIHPVAFIRTPFVSKFGIPRQSGLVDTVSEIVFAEKYRSPDCIRGLEGYSHLWLIWEFSENTDKKEALTVRPPRLGGNTRVGVFATRSPFRPNNLGLSSVKIKEIRYEASEGPVITVTGADMLDGTPIFDIKPYLPYTDIHSDAKGGFADDVFSDNLEVFVPDSVKDGIPEETLETIRKILREDPRPHYQNDPERVYAFEFLRYKIKFTVKDKALTVKEISLL